MNTPLHRMNSGMNMQSLEVRCDRPSAPTPCSIPMACEDPMLERIRINVGGFMFDTREITLARYPATLLGDPVKRRYYYNSASNEYFFDRRCDAFFAIIQYYRTGFLKRPPFMRPEDFQEEINFFQLGSDAIKSMQLYEGKNEKQRAKDIYTKKLEYCCTSLVLFVLFLILVIILVVLNQITIMGLTGKPR